MDLEPWWGIAGSPKFPCSVHILPVVVGALGIYLALLLPCVSAIWDPLFAVRTGSIHLPGGRTLVLSSEVFCLMVASLPYPPAGASRGGTQGGGSKRPTPTPSISYLVWLLGQLGFFGFLLDRNPIALSGGRKTSA